MKYMFASIVAFIIIFGAGYLFARLLLRKSSSSRRHLKTAVITVLAGSVIFLAAALVYFGSYYRANEEAQTALLGNETVSVSKIDGGFFFDGPSSSKAIIFYPGAKVECEAYASLMLKIAESDFDCFLADMPFNFALFGESAADKFFDAYSYDSWLIAGHSMGGIVAANYAEKNLDRIDGIVLLASYTTTELDDGLKLCSIYGSEDGCLEYDVYTNNKCNWPDNSYEFVIRGGNHSQFGNYGFQKSDGPAAISSDEQKEITAGTISEFFR